MTGHENLVSYPWLIGAAIAIIAIIATLSIAIMNNTKKESDKKVDKALCDQKHVYVDQAITKINDISDAVIRIEAILNDERKYRG